MSVSSKASGRGVEGGDGGVWSQLGGPWLMGSSCKLELDIYPSHSIVTLGQLILALTSVMSGMWRGARP